MKKLCRRRHKLFQEEGDSSMKASIAGRVKSEASFIEVIKNREDGTHLTNLKLM